MTERLKLTSRGYYAVTAMVFLAGAYSKPHTPTPLSDIAQQGNISLSYLEQLIAGLRRHGLVKSVRGPGGGYTLARPANTISIPDILIAAEDSIPAKKNPQGQNKEGSCPYTNALWDKAGGILFAGLKTTTLADILKN